MTDIIKTLKNCQTLVNRLREIEKNRDDTASLKLLEELSNGLANIEHDNTYLKELLSSLESELIKVKAKAKSRWADAGEEPIEQKWGCYLFKDDDALYCAKCWREYYFKIPTHPHGRQESRVCEICRSKSDLEYKSATLRERLASLQLDNIKLKAKLDKGLDIEMPNGIKWNCYIFDNDNGLYCPTCWDFKCSKSKTSRFNKNNCRICPVCHPNHPVFQTIKPNLENVKSISFKWLWNDFLRESCDVEQYRLVSITKNGLWTNRVQSVRMTKDSEFKTLNITELNTRDRVISKQLSDEQMAKLSELLYKINFKAVNQLSYFNRVEDTYTTHLEIFFDTKNYNNTEPVIINVRDGVRFDDKTMNFVEYTNIVTSPSYYKKLLEIEGDTFEYEVMVDTLKAYNELKDYIYSL